MYLPISLQFASKMIGLVLLLCFLSVNGHDYFKIRIPNGMNVTHPCKGKGKWQAVGHMEVDYTPKKNVFGKDFLKYGLKWSKELCMRDSDGDGLTNGEELGDPKCVWESGMAAGKVRGHPGFCEPDRPDCKSGMTYYKCKNSKAKGKIKKPHIRLPPGANEHPQTRKWKEMMSMKNRKNKNHVIRNLNRLPQRPHQRRTPTSNDITRTTVPSRKPVQNSWPQSGKPIVGQSVFGQVSNEPRNRNSNFRGSFQSRNRHVQPHRPPLVLTRDFGFTAVNNDDSSLHTTPTPRIDHSRSSGRHQSRLNVNGMNQRRQTFHRSPSHRQISGSTNSVHQMPSSFPRQTSHWNSFSDHSSFGRDMRTHSADSMSRPSHNRISLAGMTSDMQSNMRHGSQRDVPNSLMEIHGGQSMAHPGRLRAYPTIPGMIRAGIHDVHLPGTGMRFPPF